MTPAAAIAALDRGLAAAGQDITLRRTTGTQLIPLDVACRAVVRDYAPAELVGEIQQGDTRVILSPSEMTNAQWPWPPRAGDFVVIAGRLRAVRAAPPFYVDNVLVRVELQVRG